MLALLLSKCADDDAWLELDSLRGGKTACCTDKVAMRDSSSVGASDCGEPDS